MMAKKADEYCGRYDIPEDVYESIRDEYEGYDNFLTNNPKCYGSVEDWEEARVQTKYIIFMTMIRLTEFMESKS